MYVRTTDGGLLLLLLLLLVLGMEKYKTCVVSVLTKQIDSG